MPPRKKRVAVVLDTNVVLGFYLSPSQASPNAKVFRLWRDRRELQLILSSELTAEYLEVLPRLGVARNRVARLAQRDLLDIPALQRKKFKYEIVTPQDLLMRLKRKDKGT